MQQVTKQVTQGTPTGLYCPELCCLSPIAWAYHIQCSVTVLFPSNRTSGVLLRLSELGIVQGPGLASIYHHGEQPTHPPPPPSAHHRQTWPLCSGPWFLFPRKVCNSRPAPSSVGSGAFPGLHCASSLAASSKAFLLSRIPAPGASTISAQVVEAANKKIRCLYKCACLCVCTYACMGSFMTTWMLVSFLLT